MVASINLLRIFGLDRRVANFLNAHAENKILWNRVFCSGTILTPFVVLGIITQATLLMNNISGSPLLATLLLNFVAAVILVEILQVAQGYLDNKKLVLIPEGAWVMLQNYS